MRVLVLLSLFLVRTATAQHGAEVGSVETDIEVLYYEVEGETVGQLAASLNERSPSMGTGRFYGLTEWEVNAEYRWVERATGCKLEEVRIRLAVRTYLPRWRPGSHTDVRLRRAWDRFVRELDAHEGHHRDLILASGEAMRWQLVSLWQPSCGAMELEAQRALAAAISETEAQNNVFDEQTQHGQKQGARWPPERLDSP